MRGRFITFEGGEGTGKSTHAALLAQRLRALGIGVVLTREPGGSPGAEIIRHVLLSGAAKPFGPHAEAILFAARSEEHTSELQSLAYLVCRLLLEKKKKNTFTIPIKKKKQKRKKKK